VLRVGGVKELRPGLEVVSFCCVRVVGIVAHLGNARRFIKGGTGAEELESAAKIVQRLSCV